MRMPASNRSLHFLISPLQVTATGYAASGVSPHREGGCTHDFACHTRGRLIHEKLRSTSVSVDLLTVRDVLVFRLKMVTSEKTGVCVLLATSAR